MPFTITDEDICVLISSNLPRSHRFVLERLLAEHRFEALWEDDEVIMTLRSHCILCGAAHKPAWSLPSYPSGPCLCSFHDHLLHGSASAQICTPADNGLSMCLVSTDLQFALFDGC